MRYEIENRNDLSGAQLVIRFPEEDLDQKALYTIQAEPPGFLVPFRYRSIDGQAECTYQLGGRSKLQYRYGSREPEEYITFWQQVLTPILECSDWFLKPLSFVLDARYLYWEKAEGTISYLYVPAHTDCAEADSLRKMAAELSRQNSVTDPDLENKVLRAIMQDFQPRSFLEMLRSSRPIPRREAAAQITAPSPRSVPPAPSVVRETPSAPVRTVSEQPAPVRPPEPAGAPRPQPGTDDIVINFGEKQTGKEKKGKGFSLFGGKKEKAAPKTAAGKKGGLFGGRKEKIEKEMVLGAAAAPSEPPQSRRPYPPEPAAVWAQSTEEWEATQLEEDGRTYLRLVGDPALPREIPVGLQPGQAFTIGRFDVSVGHQQSDYEFDKQTKAVSRHHAAIEREQDGCYTLVDLDSKAGTFLNGERLTPNVPVPLTRGSRVSFGTGGADYIWEE